jgi:hypothetical protein
MLGIPVGSGYIQYVPAGLRYALSYPTPTQTGLDLSKALKSETYTKLAEKIGEENLMKRLQENARSGGEPVGEFLKNTLEDLKGSSKKRTKTSYRTVSGIFEDGNPWSGVIASAQNVSSGKNWKFVALSASGRTRRVTEFCEEFEKNHGNKARIAWNGGYILNPELVGKLGLPEAYIGSPLGLIISDYKILSLPLFNKAAMLILPDGTINIKRINSGGGFKILGSSTIEFSPDTYNNPDEDIPLSYFDLQYPDKQIPSRGRIMVRLAGTTVKEVIDGEKEIPIIPVGILLSFRKDTFPADEFKPGKDLKIILNGFENVEHAVEAGPLLLSDGKIDIDMKQEGWKTDNSIVTQAARLDYTDMRGPKIAVGTDPEGNLSVLTINGRVRESVGATHSDMAGILKKFGIVNAMGFDPGGSSTLVVDGITRNISPYNHDYEMNVYSLPPEPRAVSNAVIGFIED